MAIEKTEGILLSSSNGVGGFNGFSPKAYGGYIFDANLSINFTQPSTMQLSIVSEDGKYDEVSLANRIFPGQGMVSSPPASDGDIIPISTRGGAIDFDQIYFGGKTFNMHPLKYSISESSNGRYLQMDYYDRSISFLDKVLVMLDQKHLPPIYNPQYPPFAGGVIPANQPNIISVGSPYVNARDQDSGVPGKPSNNADLSSKLPTYLYSPIDLYNGMITCPALQGRLHPSCSNLLQYARIYGGYSQNNSNLLKDYAGTLRDVLSSWSQDLGFIFYWETATDTLGIMDLRAPIQFNTIQNSVRKALSARNIVDRTWSYSIEDTFSKGIVANFAREGIAGGKNTKMSFLGLDLLELNIHKCYVDNPEEVECEEGEGEGTIYNKTNYCVPNDDDESSAKWASLEMSNIRSQKDRMIDYIRLLKAAAIGPEFYRAYILNKKLASHTDLFPKYKKGSFENDAAAKNALNEKDIPKFGVAGPAGGASDNKKNTIVDELYYTTGKDDFNEILECKETLSNGTKITKDSYIVGQDCISIERLDQKLLQYAQLYDLAQARLVQISSNTSESSEGDVGSFILCRLKKYGLRSIITSAQDDHIFKLLNGIALNQGRFSYSKTLETQKSASRKSFSSDNVQWIDRAQDVNDTPLGSLYNSINPTAALASSPMPNSCIKDKNRESNEKNCEGEAFDDPPNTARPTIEQFIQSVYADTVVDQEAGSAANLSVTVGSNGTVTAISITKAGEGYLNSKSGEITGVISGEGSGASFTAVITDGQVSAIIISSGGSGYDEDTTAEVPGSTEHDVEKNIFGEDMESSGEAEQDSILSVNLQNRNEECQKICDKNEEIDNRKGILLIDDGGKVKIPNLIEKRIERFVNGFSTIPSNQNLSVVTFLNNAGYEVLYMAAPSSISEIKASDEYKDWFKGREELSETLDTPKVVPADELDFIVDQVEIPGLDNYFKEDDKQTKSTTVTVSEVGDKFEANAFVRPLYEANVKELTVDFMTPSLEDLGVEDADCEESSDPVKKAAKIKKDEQVVERNILNYAQSFAYQQDRVEYNTRVVVADSILQDKSNNPINLLIENGLESMTASVSEQGTKLTFSIGTRRKRRVINKPSTDMWMRVKPEFYNKIFDI